MSLREQFSFIVLAQHLIFFETWAIMEKIFTVLYVDFQELAMQES